MTSPTRPLPVLIVGAGLGGLSLAIFLHRLRVPVRVFEAYPTRAEAHGAGLMIAPNGMNVLKALGLEGKLAERGSITRRIHLRDYQGNLLGEVPINGKERYGADAVTCSRFAIYGVLADAVEASGISIEYSRRLTDVILDHPEQVTAVFEDGVSANGSLLIGADGIHSRTRDVIFPGHEELKYAGYMGFGGSILMSKLSPETIAKAGLDSGVMTSTNGPVGAWGMSETGKDASGNRMVFCWGNIPQPPRTRTEEQALTPSALKEAVLPLYQDWWDGVGEELDLVTRDDVAAKLVHGSIYDMSKDLTSWHRHRVLLIGDAAHASTPGGQGASTALEDAHFIAALLKENPGALDNLDSLTELMEQFEAHRMPRLDHLRAEARARVASRVTPLSPMAMWLRNLALKAYLWWAGESIGAQNYAYKVPGYFELRG